MLIAVGGVVLVVTRIRRGGAPHKDNNKRVGVPDAHNNGHADVQQQDADPNTSEPSTSGTSPIILTSASTSAITCLVVMTAREHASLPTPQALRHLLSLLKQQLGNADNAAVAVLLTVSLIMLLVVGAQVCVPPPLGLLALHRLSHSGSAPTRQCCTAFHRSHMQPRLHSLHFLVCGSKTARRLRAWKRRYVLEAILYHLTCVCTRWMRWRSTAC